MYPVAIKYRERRDSRKSRMGILNAKTIMMASILTFLTSSQGLLTTASKNKDGGYDYNFATVPFLAECLKLLISCYLLGSQIKNNPDQAKITREWRTVLLFPIPSVIYWVHNNVQFFTLKYVDPSTYQILGNLKIVTTGLLFWLCLRRRLTPLQWIALVLLMIGATTSQIKGQCQGEKSIWAAPVEGYMFGALSALLSAGAAVYTEWVMKRNNDSLYWQNAQLYAFGIFFNGMGLLLGDFRAGFSGGLWSSQLLHGYNWVTVLVVANLAFSGLVVSWVMKFADSIMKVYATSMAMLVTMVASVFLFSLTPTLQMLLGIATASISVILYYLNPVALTSTEIKLSPVPTRQPVLPR